jgi:prephenate dehydrogenase
MCEANAEELIPTLDHALELLDRTRNTLAVDGSVAELVGNGHAAHVRFENFSRPDILTVVIGEDHWREQLAAAGRAGAVIRSALPSRGSRG